MTDEEMKAIKDCDSIFICLDDCMSIESANYYRKSYLTLTNLIEKQQKEIEELKEKYSDEKIRNTVIKRYREVIEKNYVSKDKIKAKIEELKKEQLENQKRLRKAIDLLWDTEIEKQSDKICENMEIRKVLQSLLENINVYDKKDRKIISPKTYITKEKFVELISNLDYKYVESADIEFVTVFMYDTEKDVVIPKGYKFSIT